MLWTAFKFCAAAGMGCFLLYMADYRYERAEYVMFALDLIFGVVWLFIASRQIAGEPR